MAITLDWLGCSTYRLTVGDLVIFLDAYIDRVLSAPPIGMNVSDVGRADYILIGHSHFDHLAGAETIARNTGAKIIGSNETARVMLEQEVAPDQLLRVQGGEHHRLSEGVTVRVYPSLHSCIWTGASPSPGDVLLGDYHLTEDQRWAQDRQPRQPFVSDPVLLEQVAEHRRSTCGSSDTGGALAFVIDTPAGSIFYQDTAGCWTRIVSDLRPDVAILAMAGRANIDGEPIQGSLAQYVGRMATLLRPNRLFLGHHDNWMPPMTRDMTSPEAIAPVREELSRVEPRSELVEVGYLEATQLF